MKEKCEVSKFREGDTKEHEGVTYVAVRQKKKEICAQCVFHKYGEPCKSPRGWLCVEIGTGKNLIFKKVE